MKNSIETLLTIISLVFLASCSPPESKEVYIEGYDSLKYSVNEIKASPGQELKITLKTISTMPKENMAHNWLLLKLNTNVESFIQEGMPHKENEYVAPSLEDQVIISTGLLGGGEENTITFNAPAQKGTYHYVCTFPAHYQAGMKGVLIVE